MSENEALLEAINDLKQLMKLAIQDGLIGQKKPPPELPWYLEAIFTIVVLLMLCFFVLFLVETVKRFIKTGTIMPAEKLSRVQIVAQPQLLQGKGE